jgi:hypothetical protein
MDFRNGQDVSAFEEALKPSSRPDRTAVSQYIQTAIKECWETRKAHKSYLFVVNSNGSGKTFSCLQVCREMNSIYMTAADSDPFTTTPEVSIFLKTVSETNSLPAKDAVAAAFVKVLEECLRYTTRSNRGSFELQFKGNCFLGMTPLLRCAYDEFVDFGALLPTNKIRKTVPELKKRTVLFADEVCMDESDFRLGCTDDGAAGNGQSAGGLQGVVFFDEAHGLLGGIGIEHDECPLRCLQRALCESNLVGVFISNSSKLEYLGPHKSSGRTLPPTHAMAPIVCVGSYDVFSEHVFHLGRPLWRQWWKHRGSEDFDNLIDFAVSKLLPCRPQSGGLIASYSLFSIRFGFEALEDFCAEFVSEYLAIMTHVGTSKGDKRTAKCRWPSEPVLAEASACITIGFKGGTVGAAYTMKKVAQNVCCVLAEKRSIELNVGFKGEACIAAMMGYTMDILRARICRGGYYNASGKKQNMSCSVGALSFLSAIGVQDGEGLQERLSDYYFNFTHFLRLEEEASEFSGYLAVARRAAFYVTSGVKCVDIILVGFKRVDESSLCFLPVRIQVKSHVRKVTSTAAEVLLAAMSPESCCQPRLTGSELEIGIIFASGIGGADVLKSALCEPSAGPAHRLSNGETLKNPYYRFLLALENNGSFPVLRRYRPEVFESFRTVAQHHALAEQDPFFSEGFDLNVASVRSLQFVTC